VHPGAIAKELGVTQNLVELWRATYRPGRAANLRAI
jgi:transposase-like protein